jgi:sec-independent protein translocase protein TatA
MLLTLGVWYLRRGTCDVHAVVDRESELFFWTAVLFSNSLGTAFGDGLVYVLGLTYTTGSLVCMAVIAVVLLLFGRGKISDLMGDVAQGIKAFKKGMQDDDKPAEKPLEPAKSIDHTAPPAPSATRTDVGSKAV